MLKVLNTAHQFFYITSKVAFLFNAFMILFINDAIYMHSCIIFKTRLLRLKNWVTSESLNRVLLHAVYMYRLGAGVLAP